MLKRAAALLLIGASAVTWTSCAGTKSHYVFVALQSQSQIEVYREDPNSGILTVTVNSPYTVGSGVRALVVHPSRKFLYAANSGESDISLFKISSTGGLTEVTPRTTSGTVPVFMALDPGGKFLYVANQGSNNISVFSVDSSTGALAEVSNSPFPIGVSPASMILSPSGNTLYIGSSAQFGGFVIGFTTNAGTLTPLGTFTTGVAPVALAIDPAGKFLYTANSIDSTISEFTIDPATGSLTPIGGGLVSDSSFQHPTALLIDPAGKYVFEANTTPSTLTVYTIGTDGGLSISANPGFAASHNPEVMTIDPTGRYLYVGNQAGGLQAFAFTASTGQLFAFTSYSPGNATSIVVIP